ncbi:MAG: CPBP family intramembrane metalloprotease [Sphaerochaeta sp.]|nr:CPBP family intramembrane metalloprotease [Sphaerochaeta sp.]
MEYLRQYPQNILLITCIAFVALNVIIGPIIEELFFRGYLTSRISRFGKWAPVIVTVLFSLYHLWLPFNNVFRIVIFLPAAYVTWKERNIYISIVFHCLCNLFSTISFIIALYAV